MTWVGYVIFLVLGLGVSALFIWVLPDPVKLGQRLARRKIAQTDPWASWKAIKANLDTSRKKEHDGWQADFDRLVQATCAHEYPATSQSPTYFTCWKCKYEEPWYFVEDGCGCHFTEVKTLSSPFPEYNVTFRYGNCVWHGIDYANLNRHSDRSDKPFKDYRAITKTAPRWEDVLDY